MGEADAPRRLPPADRPLVAMLRGDAALPELRPSVFGGAPFRGRRRMAAMIRASDERGQQQRAVTQQQSAAMQQQREAEERRHEESMTALKALIAGRRTAAPETVAERTTPTDDGAGTRGD